jgi:hypothetical protein
MTSRTSIGGVLDVPAWAALYGRDQHRPTDTTVIADEIRRLHGFGLKARDIADSLRIGVSAVLQALGQR